MHPCLLLYELIIILYTYLEIYYSILLTHLSICTENISVPWPIDVVSTFYHTHYANNSLSTPYSLKTAYSCTLSNIFTVYPKKYAHGFCFAVLCCGYTLTDAPISIRLTSLALWQSNDCPSASKATLMNMDKYFMWIHYERLHNHNKAKHNKTVCIFLGIYCISILLMGQRGQHQCDTPYTPSICTVFAWAGAT